MLLRSAVVALATFTLSATAIPGNQALLPQYAPGSFCCAITKAISHFHEQPAATSFCSSYLSIKTKTVTSKKTVTSSPPPSKPVTVSTTVTPRTTVTTTSTSTLASGTKATYTTVPTSVSVTATATVTALFTTTVVQTSTSTTISASTSFATTTVIATSTTSSTTTTTELDTAFQCFTTSNPTMKAKRNPANKIAIPSCFKSIIPKEITSACNCLSIPTPTQTVTGTTTVVIPAGYPTTTTITVTARPTIITVTSVKTVTIPATTLASTAFSTGTAFATTTVTASSTSTSTSVATSTVTVTSVATSITSVFSTTTSTATVTSTTLLGSNLQFRLTTHAGAASSGGELYAAAGVSAPPYNFFYWRTQASGATTFQLDENCQLFENFAGVYAQSKPSDPNPGIVFSGSGVPVTCEIDVDTRQTTCSNPAGGDTSFLCDTTFGANTYSLWWLGEDNAPGSRCSEHEMIAAYTL